MNGSTVGGIAVKGQLVFVFINQVKTAVGIIDPNMCRGRLGMRSTDCMYFFKLLIGHTDAIVIDCDLKETI